MQENRIWTEDEVVEKFKNDVKIEYNAGVLKPRIMQAPPTHRLWYIGSHYPEGYSPEKIVDDAWEFTQEILDTSSVTDIPITHEHDSAVEVGKVCCHMRDKNGRQYHVGYVDDNTLEGKVVQDGIQKGTLSELSLMNVTGYLGKNLADDLKKVMVPLHIAVVKQGQKPGCKIIWHKKELFDCLTKQGIKNTTRHNLFYFFFFAMSYISLRNRKI